MLKLSARALVLSLCLLLPPWIPLTPALAQDVEASGPDADAEVDAGEKTFPTQVEEITVTARRRDETVQEIPGAISVITEDTSRSSRSPTPATSSASYPTWSSSATPAPRAAPRSSFAASAPTSRCSPPSRRSVSTSTTSTSRARPVPPSTSSTWTGSRSYAVPKAPSPLIATDDYSILNARIAYGPTAGNWEVALVGTNLTDEEYFTGGFDIDVLGIGVAYLNKPAWYGGTFSYRF